MSEPALPTMPALKSRMNRDREAARRDRAGYTRVSDSSERADAVLTRTVGLAAAGSGSIVVQWLSVLPN